jgi:ribosomal protein S18 acetylase RimI-like enzyme
VPEVVVRPALPEEVDAVGVLTEHVYRTGGFSSDSYGRVLLDAAIRRSTANLLVALVDGRLAGTVTLAVPGTPFAEIAHDDELEVRMLAVAEDARRLGVADRLMDAAEDLARAHDLAAVILSTDPDMHAAHRLYERRGYVRRPDRDWEVDEFTLIVYRRALA